MPNGGYLKGAYRPGTDPYGAARAFRDSGASPLGDPYVPLAVQKAIQGASAAQQQAVAESMRMVSDRARRQIDDAVRAEFAAQQVRAHDIILGKMQARADRGGYAALAIGRRLGPGQFGRLFDLAGQLMQPVGLGPPKVVTPVPSYYVAACDPVPPTIPEYYSGPWFASGASCALMGQAGPAPGLEEPTYGRTIEYRDFHMPGGGGPVNEIWVRDAVHHAYYRQWWNRTAEPYGGEPEGTWPTKWPYVRRHMQYLPVADVVPPPPRVKPGIRGEPGAPAKPDEGRPASPPPGITDKKFLIRGALGVLLKGSKDAINAVTESMDVAECMWKAIPQKHRTRVVGRKVGGKGPTIFPPKGANSAKALYRRHGKAGAKAIMGTEGKPGTNASWARYNAAIPVHPTPQMVAREVSQHWDKMDAKKAQDCVVQNTITDFVVGKAAGQANKGFLQTAGGRPIGLGFGPAL